MKTISIDLSGRIKISNTDTAPACFDFNTYYRGYYPACEFTAAGIVGSFFYAAGSDMTGVPHLFRSMDGTIWEEQNITPKYHFPDPKDYGNPKKILSAGESDTFYLITENGYLLTIPDCPECVRARKISDVCLTDGWIEKDMICVQDINNSVTDYPLYSAAQHRRSWAFAARHLGKDGILFDLRDTGNFAGDTVQYPKDFYLFFFCEKGYKADEAVRLARADGFYKAYSLGGVQDILTDLIKGGSS